MFGIDEMSDDRSGSDEVMPSISAAAMWAPRRLASMLGVSDALRRVRARAIERLKGWKLYADRRHRTSVLAQLEACSRPSDLLAFASTHLVAAQVASEILALAEFASRRSPRVFCEVGTQTGGTHLFLTRALPSVTTTIAIDL